MVSASPLTAEVVELEGEDSSEADVRQVFDFVVDSQARS